MKIVGLLFILGAGIFACFFARDWKMARESLSWPQVTGTITRSDVRCTSSASDPRRMGHHSWYPVVRYSYAVGGKHYSATRIRFMGVSSGSCETAQQNANRYPLGDSVAVYYHPADPSNAVLAQGVQSGMWFPFGIIFGLMVIGGYLVWSKK